MKWNTWESRLLSGSSSAEDMPQGHTHGQWRQHNDDPLSSLSCLLKIAF